MYQITDNSYDDGAPQIAGNWIAWEGNGEVWRTQTPEPTTLLVVALGAGLLLRRRLRRSRGASA